MNELSGPQIRSSFVRAARLDQNWRSNSSRVRALSRIHHGDIVFRMQFVGPNVLVTLSRDPKASVSLSVWNTESPAESSRVQVVSLETTSTANFSASLQANRRDLIVATTSAISHGPKYPPLSKPFSQLTFSNSRHSFIINVYRIPLVLSHNDLSPYHLLKTISRPVQDGVIHNIQVSGSLVAASVTKFETTANAPSYRLLIYDSSTDQERFLDPILPQVGLII
jgi:hypothetical protein